LENAIGQVHELRSVKAQAAQHKTQNGGIDLTCEQYCSLLSSAAQEYNGGLVRSVKTAPSAARCSIYYTKFELHTIEDEFFDVAYDIDTSPNDILEANVHGFGGPRLNANQWGCLLQEAQENWDQLDQASKAIILEHMLRPPPGGTVQGPPRRDFGRPSGGRFAPRNRPADTAVNLHDISTAEYLAYTHQMSLGETFDNTKIAIDIPPEPDPPVTLLFAHMAKKKDIHPGDITRVFFQSMAKGSASPARKLVVQDGVRYYEANQHIQYWASSHRQVRTSALVDRGANGGIAGDDVWIINRTGPQVDVQGIDNYQIVDIPIVTAGAVMKMQPGEDIIILHQYAYAGKGKTIHSSGQREWYKQEVDDRSIKVGGKQRIKTLEGYVIPIDVKSGLPYVMTKLHQPRMGFATPCHFAWRW
jgi:hypothetical protein